MEGVIRSDGLMERGDSLPADSSWWPVVCSGVSTCTLGNATDLRKPMVASALDLGWRGRKLGWFGRLEGRKGSFLPAKEVLH